MDILETIPPKMKDYLVEAADLVREAKSVVAISHIDADGITSLAIVLQTLERSGLTPIWKNIHQLNSETIKEVRDIVRENRPDLLIFSDLGTGQKRSIEELVKTEDYIQHTIILDHHLPQDDDSATDGNSERIIEINPHNHGIDGSYEISGAGVSFLLAIAVDPRNVDLSELAIVGATGDLQRYYGRGFVGVNKSILAFAEEHAIVRIKRDLTFFGINTRPLPFLLEYATDPYLPGLTGERDACYEFFESRHIPLKNEYDEWRVWTDLSPEEKSRAIQGIIHVIIDAGYSTHVAQGIIGDVVELLHRPLRSEMRNAKEFSTLLNACGRNSRPEIGVLVCMNAEDAYVQARTLLQVHRQNLAQALRRLEQNGYDETEGMYLVNDPETPDTIVGIVIGMAQGSRIVPTNRPVLGIATRTTDDSPFVKISGRAQKSLVKRGINLKETFVEVAHLLNEQYDKLVVEAGGHPMAAGAFVLSEHLDEFLELVSMRFTRVLHGEIKK
ncbi:MAG: DHH family phosphoesterase [Candidatus Thorarchaeota archaeon]